MDKKNIITENKSLSPKSFPKDKKDSLEKNLFTKLDEKKNYKNEEIKRTRLESLHYRRPDPYIKEPTELFINIEKKQILERSPDHEKKTMQKVVVKPSSPFKTFYGKKNFSEGSSIDVPVVLPPPRTSGTFLQRHFSPYDTWKANNSIPVGKKVFIINGNYPDVRKALLQRGWVENSDNESIYFDLKWARNARVPQNMLEWQFYNHFPRNFELSVKWQLYDNIKMTNKVTRANYLTFMPRSFRLDSKGHEDFSETFKANYSVSILKNFMKYPNKYLPDQIIIANTICKRWIQELEKQNYFEERVSPLVMNIEWKILTSKDPNEIKNSFARIMINSNQDAYSMTIKTLEKLEEVDPQFCLNGSKNIWIVKAGRKSRGRDIALFNDINQLRMHTSTSNSWVVQKYIENPLIISNRKFDIRQWVLISSSDPLTIWIYKKSYLRFSLENYSDDNITNPYIHLTNNSISKKSTKFSSSEIKGCMWSIEQFQEYLKNEKNIDVWNTQIFPAIKKIVKYSLLAIGNLGRKNSFEILGYDFMIDDTLKPWLLEINSSPAMDYSTNVTEILVKEVLEDAIKVIVDFPSGVLDTGNFELCYKAKNYLPFRRTTLF
ncbi:hypothetical protein SteCoe_26789 [Stentor coeruleus]|uniref:Tubulin--tyrosine ligase-like protein 9 n=1 Tax=Stentor coeruleus TaxID=5963 RepID=A0A1R2BC13_9CILI|nr:hypothetical protein SteCoe_26789 [Stentor coeruleus]